MKRKYRFTDRAAAESEVLRLEQQATVYRICLSESVAGLVEWRTAGDYRLGLIRLDSPTGGYCILEHAPRGQRADSTAWNLDDFIAWVREFSLASGPEINDLRSLSTWAREQRWKAQAA